ncbi:MAG: sigma-70 family RNA polymerase sigma factor [Verrucomicrobiales bacterium]|nr:sigma-70 family RNA polymerase sigma factor [Verrucomicrobiales bacterium]
MSHTAAAFPSTRWSLVAAARSGGARRAALEELCRLYWPPLYAFARRAGLPRADAEDATQAFFAAILNDTTLDAASVGQGRLRTFLLAAFSRDLIDAHRRSTAQRRGGGVQVVPLDADSVEAQVPLRDGESPESQYDHDWAVCVLRDAVNAVRRTWDEAGKVFLFDTLRVFLSPVGEPPTYELLGAELGQSVEALRQTVARLRQQFRTALRRIVADTLVHPTPSQVDQELKALRAALSLS